MSFAPAPDSPPRESRDASFMWAVAAIVIALVVGFVAWLLLGDRGGDGGTAGAPPTATAGQTPGAEGTPGADDVDRETTGPGGAGVAGSEETATQDEGADGEGAGAAATAAPPTAQTPPPDVVELMLGLQRRDADDVLAVGDVDAPVVMIEYADYRCPYCAQFHLQTRPELASLVEDGTLRIEFRDLVLFQEASELAAVAVRAAAAQGHLEDYQREVFALSSDGHGEYDRADLVALAEEVGVEDVAAFEEALDDPEILAQVRADTEEARSIGVSSTPTFLVNTQVVQGAYPADHFRQVIQAEVERAEAGTQGR